MAPPALFALFALLALAACEPAGPPSPPSPSASSARAWPAGTVMAVDDVVLRAEDVDPLADAIRELYPEYTRPHRRRLALTNVALPRAAARARRAAEREAALARCRAVHDELVAGDGAPADAVALDGDWTVLGLDLWFAARGREPGRWSEPIELIGRWVLVRLDEVRPNPSGWEELAVTRVEFPYADPQEIDGSIDAARLTLVDPDWSETVPERWKRRMGLASSGTR